MRISEKNRIVGSLVLILAFVCPVLPAGAEIRDAGKLFVVDCLLPGQIRQLGSMTYAAARKAVKVTAGECEARGGEFVAYDRASQATTLKVWLPLAEKGDPEAQTYVGEAYEKGFGATPDYGTAAAWYLAAAEQGYSRAAINLGSLFERGLGLAKDPEMAKFWYRKASEASGLKPPEPAASGNEAATITIIEPVLEEDNIMAEPRSEFDIDNPLLVIGQVESSIPLRDVVVNGQSAKLSGSLFRVMALPIDGTIEVVAHDEKGRITRLNFYLDPDIAPFEGLRRQAPGYRIEPAPAGLGRYHALVIGNNDYSKLDRLFTAVNDARAVANQLRENYGFTVTELYDADRYQVLSALNRLRSDFAEDDHLLVYYAGHGELDRVNRRGYWLPTDAEASNPVNWISNISITDMLNIIPARQLIVIADSCYSGMMSRSVLATVDEAISDEKRTEQLMAMTGARTRTALTSGGIAPVLDSVGGKHSVFAAELLNALEKNAGAMTGLQLYEFVSPRVSRASSQVGFDQQPEYAPLKFAGHEAGDFVFYRKSRKE